ncbi:MAG: hypothetical protein KGR26_13530, partial [Cyanobacteria bacterium REEB65]|nr:hypothetical protein [Cyanobacteria bacterium REEB65]
MKLSIGLLVIATRRYREKFVGSFLSNNLPKFFPEDDVTVHLFSEESWPGTTWHPTESLGFPRVTLLRYHLFLAAQPFLIEHSHLYYLDVDSRLERVIGREVLPPEHGIVALHHTGFPTGTGAWETRQGQSAAYVPPEGRKTYYMGGFNGGSSP